MIALKNVLVVTDFGEPAGVALTYGRQLARTFGSTLHVAHVVDDMSGRLVEVAGVPEYVGSVEHIQARANASAKAELDKLLYEEDRVQLHAKPVILTSSKPAQAIIEYAAGHRIDLIIAGTHGRGAVGHFFMGSVADRLVRAAPCPVLIVRHPEHEFVLPDALQKVAPG